MDQKQKTLIVIAGPTAVGKTALAIELAKHYQTEIVSADSRQFFREMNIGTAKPTDDELAEAKHWFVNSHTVTEDYNVGDFEQDGLRALDEIFATHDMAILAGGSGLYIKAICEGFDDLPSTNKFIRAELNTTIEEKGLAFLQEELKTADPVYYAQVDINNPHRVIRALEVIRETGKPFSLFRTANVRHRSFHIVKIALNLPREVLYDRINQRVDLMMEQGLLKEVTSLLPYRDYNALNTVGYSELFDYLDGQSDLPTAIALIKQNTRRFAKRQITWFNRDKDFTWFEPGQVDEIIKHIDLS
ncbi:tRNA (adenosine(37)-N6)-dimethylallyltransferase MiaA [Mucilaginibacter sp. PPCGB 2223]|uniref:tRNA (adenosine(37)-N6)-dimethylallyltransferase MiaA n=1 Tax=Mucilaginibacter sp. PPCGB 2223 TaxID=1886027 RepID=UPI0008250388|nr:tRNA (adenosine(37)-N6)-dimethylallyltransferase MiaA [Mucilaginibacter sp. PPCGB 2223]OCX54530.1 tRNA (adenosine(37)-N6)-dimethylallyltransferase MiaA [Mucilaginibacter sp. PPCGB 2223]